MAKHMSKTLAAEIAGRTLEVVNPANRAMALSAALKRHGFEAETLAPAEVLAGKAELAAWLIATYARRES